jgi:hypothetical protein
VRLPTASKVALATACTFSWSTRAPRVPFEPMSAASAKGNNVHSACERLVRGEAVDFAALTADEVALVRGAEAFMAERLYGDTTLRAEVPLAYDVETGAGRELPGGGHRAYDTRRRTEIVGTTDVLGENLILDWKTGTYARGTRAEDSWQLRVLALSAARAYGWREVVVGYVHLDAGDFYLDRATLGPWELDETADELARVYAEIEADTMAPKPGAHCHEGWCPIRSACPATKAALVQIDADAASFIPTGFQVANDDDAKRARVVLKLVDEASKRLDESLKAYVRRVGHIDLGGGRVYGIKEQSRDTVTLTRDAADVLVAAGAAEALEISTSKAAIQRALAATKTKRGEAKRATDGVVETLREMGCVRTSTFERLEEFDLKKETA